MTWKSGLVELFQLKDCVPQQDLLFDKFADPAALMFFAEASDKIISTEVGKYDMIVGIGAGGFLQGPLLSQKHGVPFVPINSAAGLEQCM